MNYYEYLFLCIFSSISQVNRQGLANTIETELFVFFIK